MPLTPWAQTTSDGTIADTPGTCFRYKYTLDIWIPVPVTYGPTTTLVTGAWRVRVITMTNEEAAAALGLAEKFSRDALSAEDWLAIKYRQTIFEQTVELRYVLVTIMAADFFGTPLLSFFAWWFDNAYQRITTTICGSRMATGKTAAVVGRTDTAIPLTDVEGNFTRAGGAYVGYERIIYNSFANRILGDITTRGEYGGPWAWPPGTDVRQAPSTIGHETGYAVNDAASDWDYTNRELHIMGSFVGPIYQLDVPAGAQVVIDYHNVGLTKLKFAVAAVQTQVCGGNVACVRDPYQGMSWAVVPNDDGGQSLASQHDSGAAGPFASTLSGVGGGRLLRFAHSTRMGLLGDAPAGIGYIESTAEGQEGTWSDMAIVLPGVDLITACLSEDAGMLWIIGRDAALQVYQAAKDPVSGAFVAGPPITPTGLGNVEPGSFMQDRFGELHIISQGAEGITHYRSTDGGETWA